VKSVHLACASIFAAPINKRERNSVFATGDGGGRMRNPAAPQVKSFVTIPAHHFQHVLNLMANFRFDPAKMRKLIMPSHAPADIGAGTRNKKLIVATREAIQWMGRRVQVWDQVYQRQG
jgi:hypothetical protein